MDQSKPTWELFENLVRRILEANKFQIEVHVPRGDDGFDFLGTLSNELWAIEVKYYRTVHARLTLIEAAASRIVSNGSSADAQKGMLIVSCVIPQDMRKALEEKFSVTFVDRVYLRSLTTAFPLLTEELEDLLETEPSALSKSKPTRNDFLTKSKSLKEGHPPLRDTRGTELCQRLHSIKKGRKGWAQYEEICTNILQYLYPQDLQGWHKQKGTDDGLNRFDFVCRVRPTTDFWKFVIDHLDSRYVLFEFKNYTGKIKQGQILTTEKYLLERGLRKVAIILTRIGADTHAIATTQGAMREHGKLMLIIDDEMLCKMLHMKERGNDPTDYLFEVADSFLMSLPR